MTTGNAHNRVPDDSYPHLLSVECDCKPVYAEGKLWHRSMKHIVEWQCPDHIPEDWVKS